MISSVKKGLDKGQGRNMSIFLESMVRKDLSEVLAQACSTCRSSTGPELVNAQKKHWRGDVRCGEGKGEVDNEIGG